MTVIIGPYFENWTETKTEAGRCPGRVRLVKSPSSVQDLMLNADMAISGGGQTLYELAAAGTPVVAIQVAENQAPNLQALEKAGCLVATGKAGSPGLFEVVIAKTSTLLTDQETRQQMSVAGQRLIDGRGALRVSEALLRELGSITTEDDFK